MMEPKAPSPPCGRRLNRVGAFRDFDAAFAKDPCPMLLLASWTTNIFSVLFFFTCVLMMGAILIQKPRGGGLSGAFGGAGGSAQSAFGGKTGDVLTWFTVVL